MRFRNLDDADVKGKRVLLRVDLNVPMQEGKILDSTRMTLSPCASPSRMHR